MYKYPYGDSQQLNLDWIISKIKELEAGGSGGAADLEAVANALVTLSFNLNTQYRRYDYCFLNGKLYRCLSDTSGVFDPPAWQEALIGDDLAVLTRWINAIDAAAVVDVKFDTSGTNGKLQQKYHDEYHDVVEVDYTPVQNSKRPLSSNAGYELNSALNAQSYIYPDLYGAKYDGVTDCTTIIQQVINESVTKGKIVRFTGTGTALISAPLNLPSKAHIKLDPQFTLKMANNSNCPMFVNPARNIAYNSPDAGQVLYYDNCIEGGTLNFNGDNQTFNNQRYHESAGIVLTDIRRFELKNIRLVDPITFGTLFSNMENFTIENVHLDYTNQHGNMDGIHLSGGCAYGTIQNIYGQTNDDMIALNPGDSLARFASLRVGAMHDIEVRNIKAENGYRAVRLLASESNASPMYNVLIDGIYGSYRYEAVIFSTYTDTTDAVYKNITIKNILCEKLSGVSIIYWWSNYNNNGATIHAENIIIDGISYRQHTNYVETIMAVASQTTIEQITLDNIYIFTDDVDNSSKYVITGAGLIKLLFFNNAFIAAPATQAKNAGFGATAINRAFISNCVFAITNKYAPSSSLNEVNTLINGTNSDTYSLYKKGDAVSFSNGFTALGAINSAGTGFGAYVFLPKEIPGDLSITQNLTPVFFQGATRHIGPTITSVTRTGINQITILGNLPSGETDTPAMVGFLNLSGGSISFS